MLNPKNPELDRLQAVVAKLKKAGNRPALTPDEIAKWANPDQKVGLGPITPAEKPARDAFLVKEKDTVLQFQRQAVEIPNWLKAKIETKATPTEVLDYLMERVRKAPSKDSLILMQMVLNDIGRKPDGNKHFSALIQKQNIVEFISLTNPKK